MSTKKRMIVFNSSGTCLLIFFITQLLHSAYVASRPLEVLPASALTMLQDWNLPSSQEYLYDRGTTFSLRRDPQMLIVIPRTKDPELLFQIYRCIDGTVITQQSRYGVLLFFQELQNQTKILGKIAQLPNLFYMMPIYISGTYVRDAFTGRCLIVFKKGIDAKAQEAILQHYKMQIQEGDTGFYYTTLQSRDKAILTIMQEIGSNPLVESAILEFDMLSIPHVPNFKKHQHDPSQQSQQSSSQRTYTIAAQIGK